MTFFLLTDWPEISKELQVIENSGHKLSIVLAKDLNEISHVIIPPSPDFVLHSIGGHKIKNYPNILNFRYINFFTE